MNKQIRIRVIILGILFLMAAITINHNFTSKKNEETKKAEEYSKYIENKNKERSLREEEIKKDEPIQAKLNEAKDLIALNTEQNYEKAINICNELIKNNDKEYRAYTLRGVCYAYTSGVVSKNKNKAIEDIDKALSIKSDYMYGLYIKGVILDNFAQYDEALTWYDKSLALEKYPWSYYNKAVIYAKQGNKDEATKNLKAAMEIKPELKEKAKKEVSFEIIKDTELLK